MMESMFYVLCTTIPIHITVFTLYWRYSWRSKKLAFILEAINFVCKMAVMGFVTYHGWSARIIELLFSALGASIYFFTIRVNLFQLLFTYILGIDYLMFVRGGSAYIATHLLSAGYQSWQASVICLLLYVITLPWLLHFFGKAIHQAFQTDAPSLWRVIWIPPALITIVVFLYTDTFNAASVWDWKAFFARLSLLGCNMAAYYMLLQALEEFRYRAVLEEKEQQNQQILLLQRSQYATLQSHMDEIRRARHDLRQHQNILRSFLDSGDTGKLRAYLESQLSSLPADSLRQYCRNYAANLLLNHYAGKFLQLGIDFEFRIELPEKLHSAEPDICVVIGNLLENAQEACTGQKDPYIRTVAQMSGASSLTIIVDNTAPVPPKIQEDGSFYSSKRPGAGIGTQSVRYIAGRYGGTTDFR